MDKTFKVLCLSGRIADAVQLLLCGGSSPISHQSYSILLQETIHRKEFNLGRKIHAHMTITGFTPGDYLSTKLLIFYAKAGMLQAAQHLFDEMPLPNLIAYNAMISGCVRSELELEGLELFYLMRANGLEPNQFTFASVFRACAGLAMLEHGRRAHCIMIKTQMKKANVIVKSSLVDMYFKCSSVDDARRVFDSSTERNVVTWTALISGYGQHGRVRDAIELFHRMVEEGFRPNSVTLLALLSACGHRGLIEDGWRYFTSMTADYGIRPGKEHYAVMVDMLGRAGKLNDAFEFSLAAPCNQHSVACGALIGACRIHGDVDLLRQAANRLFKLQPENVGKYVVLSNAFAAAEMWEKVSDARQRVRMLGTRKAPAWSSVEVQGVVHKFLVRDTSHKQCRLIYEMIKALNCASRDTDIS